MPDLTTVVLDVFEESLVKVTTYLLDKRHFFQVHSWSKAQVTMAASSGFGNTRASSINRSLEGKKKARFHTIPPRRCTELAEHCHPEMRQHQCSPFPPYFLDNGRTDRRTEIINQLNEDGLVFQQRKYPSCNDTVAIDLNVEMLSEYVRTRA